MSKPIKFSIIVLVLSLITVFTFFNVKNCDFINLDDNLIIQNKNVTSGLTLKNISWSFTATYSYNWMPLTWISHMIDFDLYGSKAFGHHITNLIFHILNTLLLFFVLFKLTGSLWRSFFVASLFAVHPMHVESVAWITERKDVLSTFFWMLTMLFYVYYAKNKKIIIYISAISFFVLGLMAKPMLVTLPFVLFLIDFWPLKRINLNDSFFNIRAKILKLIIEKIPFFIFAIISCIITFNVQNITGAVRTVEQCSLAMRAANAFASYILYLGKLIWPFKLSIFYPYPRLTVIWQEPFCALLILFFITVLSLMTIKRFSYIFVGWFWYIGTLVPVIGFVQVGNQAMADRYTYIPYIGIFIIIAWGIYDISKNWKYKKIILSILAALFILFLVLNTKEYVKVWKNSKTLFIHALNVTKNNYVAHMQLGLAFQDEGLHRNAIFQYEKALKIIPGFKAAINNLGLQYQAIGDNKKAKSIYENAIKNKNVNDTIYYNYASLLYKTGKINDAIKYYKKALDLNHNLELARFNLAFLLFNQGKIDQSINEFKKVEKLNPLNIDVYKNLSKIYVFTKNRPKAISYIKKVLQYEPNNEEVRYNLANLLVLEKKRNQAIDQYKKLIKINPNSFKYFNLLGKQLVLQKKIGKACNYFKKSYEINSNNSETLCNLGNCFYYKGKIKTAKQYFEKALALKPGYKRALKNLKVIEKQNKLQ